MPESVFHIGAERHQQAFMGPANDAYLLREWKTGRMIYEIGRAVVGEPDAKHQYDLLDRFESVRDVDYDLHGAHADVRRVRVRVESLMTDDDRVRAMAFMTDGGNPCYVMWGLGLCSLGYRIMKAAHEGGLAEIQALKMSINTTLKNHTFFYTLPVFHFI
ncbi:protein ORF36 [Cyprinid herpesvirus 3]|nr:unnamed protein product [Cyprinid herpesvirus 3]ABF81805.1 hypothetical protein [Cyprinid herpesvirus 3]ABG42864.1 protein ORF36 [Cyprinid herpesvirus 3]AIC32391.1 ORF36R [Cyprinid herpesvirus 3]AJP55526.1 protein ORF36 [Cyprinid herpesvirus 3]AJP55683.1 protein ORF36 [Cyprinid herpesvirus 3]